MSNHNLERNMAYNPREFEYRSRGLLSSWQIGVGVITGTAGLGLFGAEFFRLQQAPRSAADYLYLTLLAINLVLIPIWIWVIRREYDALVEWLDPEAYPPPSDIRQLFDAVLIACLLVVLLIAARDPFWFGVVHCVTTASVLFMVTRQLNPEITKAVRASRSHLAQDGAVPDARLRIVFSRGIDVLERYFLKRPHVWRYAGGLMGGLLGLAFAAAWKLTGDQRWQIASYAVFVVVLTSLEALIDHWRLERDRALRRLGGERLAITGGSLVQGRKRGRQLQRS